MCGLKGSLREKGPLGLPGANLDDSETVIAQVPTISKLKMILKTQGIVNRKHWRACFCFCFGGPVGKLKKMRCAYP